MKLFSRSPSMPPIKAADFKKGMGLLAASVNLITTCNGANRIGCTATAVCSLSDNPPSLIICLNKNSGTAKAVQQTGLVCVNVCSQDDAETAVFFAMSGNDKFSAGLWEETPKTGTPRLATAITSFDCEVHRVTDHGSHDIVIANVVDIFFNETTSSALLYADRTYGTFAASPGS